jgi:iron complex transport system substrate-binding protein
MRTASSRLVVATATFLSLSLVAAACGADGATESDPSIPAPAPEPASPGEPVDGFPVTVDVDGTPFTLATRPERIVSLSPSSTEGLFAIGAGPQVIAADEFSDFPAEAPTTTLSGVTPNVEAIVAYDPDLVVVSFDPGDLVASLEAAGIPVLVLEGAIDLDGVLRQLVILGEVTGNAVNALSVAADLEDRIAAAVAGAPELAAPLTFFHLIDETLFTVTSATFVGAVYSLFGLVNVADAADPDGSAFGYPQLSAEFLVDADPDLVFLANGDAASFVELPVLGQLRAVENGTVVELAPDVSSRWGPRIVDFIEQIALVVAEASDTVVSVP